MTLLDTDNQMDVRILSLPENHNLRNRLLGLGLAPGVRVRVLNRSGGGPMLLAINATRVALGRRLASRITVEMIPDDMGGHA